jgi:cytochrome P450
VLCELLGIPVADRAWIAVTVAAYDERAEHQRVERELAGYELLATIFLLVMAGFDTTVNLIASSTLALITHPEEMARLRQDPALLTAAVEELLRFTNPASPDRSWKFERAR